MLNRNSKTIRHIVKKGKNGQLGVPLLSVFLLASMAGGVVAAPVNLALNKTGVASSLESATLYQAAKAFDGNTTTRWASAMTDSQWISVDLGANYTVNGVKLVWEAAYAKAFKIQASNDASAWVDIYSTTTGSGGTQDLTVTPTTARYIRIYGTVRGTMWGYSLWEMEVYGSVPAPAPAPVPVTGCNKTYYVSPAGNNSNAGTISAPWKTIAKAAATLVRGNCVYVRGGTYIENNVWFWTSGTATQPIQFLAYPGETPIIDGTGNGTYSSNKMLAIAGSYVVISGFEVRYGAMGVEAWSPYDTVRNMNVHHMWGNAISVYGDYSLIENNTVSYTSMVNSGKTMSGGWAGGITAAYGANHDIIKHAIIRGNTAHDIYGECINTYEADGTIVENNVVYDCYATNFYISDARNVIFRNNLSYFTTGTTMPRGTRSLLQLSDEVSAKPRSANNVVIDNMFFNGNLLAFEWTGVAGSGLVNALIANNTLVNGALITRDRGTATKGNKIQNNILYRNDGGSVANVPSNVGLTFSNNLWSTAPPSTAKGSGDIVGNPSLSLSGGAGPGQLATGYFALPSTSPAIGKGAAIYAVTDDYLITNSAALNIGAYPSEPPVTYLTGTSVAKAP